MKNLKLNLFSWVKQQHVKILALGFGLFALSSCLKDSDLASPDYSALSVINASPGLEPFDFAIDRQLINQGSFAYTTRLPYVDIYSGTRNIGIYKDQTTDSLKTGILTAEPGKIYSLYVIGQPSSLEFLTIKDSLTTPATGKAHVRFINLSINSPALKLNYGVDSTLFNNINYKSHTGFVEIPGGKTYNFSVNNTTNNGNTASNSSVLIESGRIYTVWASGLYNNTDSLKLGLKVQRNN